MKLHNKSIVITGASSGMGSFSPAKVQTLSPLRAALNVLKSWQPL